MVIQRTNPFLLHGNEKFFIFTCKNDTPSHSKIASNFETFGSLSGDVFDSENVLDHENVSRMSSQLLYEIIALHQSHSECLKWFYSSYVAVQSQKV